MQQKILHPFLKNCLFSKNSCCVAEMLQQLQIPLIKTALRSKFPFHGKGNLDRNGIKQLGRIFWQDNRLFRCSDCRCELLPTAN